MVSSLIDEDTRHWKIDKVKRHFLPLWLNVVGLYMISLWNFQMEFTKNNNNNNFQMEEEKH